MLIYVLRHGITQWNKLKKVQGAMDIPLAPEGIELAKRTGEALKDVPFDICFTSPLARAKQTAHYVLGNRQIPVIEDKRIQEIDFGVLEGSRFKDEQGKIISHEMEIFFEEPQKFERPQNGENISDILNHLIGHLVITHIHQPLCQCRNQCAHTNLNHHLNYSRKIHFAFSDHIINCMSCQLWNI